MFRDKWLNHSSHYFLEASPCLQSDSKHMLVVSKATVWRGCWRPSLYSIWRHKDSCVPQFGHTSKIFPIVQFYFCHRAIEYKGHGIEPWGEWVRKGENSRTHWGKREEPHLCFFTSMERGWWCHHKQNGEIGKDWVWAQVGHLQMEAPMGAPREAHCGCSQRCSWKWVGVRLKRKAGLKMYGRLHGGGNR